MENSNPGTTPTANQESNEATISSKQRTDRHNGSGVDATKALKVLMERRHGSFSDFRPHGDDFTVHVMEHGHRVAVLIDPDSGTMTPLPDQAGRSGGPIQRGDGSAGRASGAR